ncbi:MAG: MBL fold metallo-hydrolase [Xanthobacteraceae bacterium]|nr:MBL fold metallo-hydrolase [Xanthobacteraceae bacterium]MCW5679436.1 MBL fold metallo-hydrolase [Xanthobacteraceae bacterium]
MSDISRRTLLTTSTAALGTMSVAPAFLEGFFSSAMAQSAGFNKYKVGSIEAAGIADGVNTFPLPDRFVVNQPREEVQKALAAAKLDTEKLSIPFNPFVFQNGSRVVLIDTGMGPAANEKTPAVGNTVKNLSAVGYDPSKITDVVISHFHGDHINGLLNGANPTYPNAQVWVPAAEWKYWTDEGELSRAPDARKGAFANVKRIFADGLKNKVTQYEHGKEVVPGLTALATFGHTPGHTSFVLASGSDKLFIQSDVTNIPALFVANPGWHAMFDQDAKMAEETRRKTYDMVSAEKMRVQGFHFPFPSLGRIEKTATGYNLVAA